jgi:uncharacterized membrane protein
MSKEKRDNESTLDDSKSKINFQKHKDLHVIEDVVKVGKRFNLIRTFMTRSGEIVTRTVSPLMVHFERKDIAQVFIGSLLLSTPFMVTEEVWKLGEELSIPSAIALVFLSLMSLIVLVYYTRYQTVRTADGKIPKTEFVKRIFGSYILTLSIVAILLTIIGKAPWSTDYLTALKRTILIGLPASLGGSVADLLK